jgi:hypothetical protein
MNYNKEFNPFNIHSQSLLIYKIKLILDKTKNDKHDKTSLTDDKSDNLDKNTETKARQLDTILFIYSLTTTKTSLGTIVFSLAISLF